MDATPFRWFPLQDGLSPHYAKLQWGTPGRGFVGAYLGHFAGLPNDQFLAFGADFQDVLDGVDKIGQADESSVRPIQHRLLIRVTMTRAGDDLVFFHVPDDPFVDITEDLTVLHENPGRGPTGDTLRSYGPQCPMCGARHFPDQECRVFHEFSNRLRVGLFASKTHPGQGVIEIYEYEAHTPNHFPSMVHVGDLDELNAFGLLPFLYIGGRYLSDAEPDVDLDAELLLLACEEAGVTIPVDPELEEE